MAIRSMSGLPHLKYDIDRYVLSTRPFLRNFYGLRYLKNSVAHYLYVDFQYIFFLLRDCPKNLIWSLMDPFCLNRRCGGPSTASKDRVNIVIGEMHFEL